MTEVERFLDHTFFHNALWQWLVAAGVFAGVFTVAMLIRRIIRNRSARLAATPEVELMALPLKVASHTALLFLLVVALYAGLQVLVLPDKWSAMLRSIVTIAAFWQVGVWVSSGVTAWLQRRQRQSMAQDRAAAGSFVIIGFVARALIWVLVLLLTLDNLGINITALVAGLGVGGIAVALALQNILGDLFASLSITLDRPFVVGDAVAIDDFSGTVEQIGIKSVRLRSVSGEQIVMSNADLLKSRLRNFGRMRERRIAFTIGLALDTQQEQLRKLPPALRSIVQAQQHTRFDRCHFARIGPASLDFETVYFVTTADYGIYMDIQQTINLRIMELLENNGIQLAVPMQRQWQPQSGVLESGGPEKAA